MFLKTSIIMSSSITKLMGMNMRRLISSSCVMTSQGVADRALGQPSHFTHPYIIEKNEVTPRITKREYEGRRLKLLYKLKEKGSKHVAIISGNQLQYMSEDIPYPFHQKTNFLYLTGFLEPDSCLLLEADFDQSHFRSVLLVNERDAKKELWHGPRSGVDGALFLTGVDETDTIDQLSQRLAQYTSTDHHIWCDYSEVMNMKIYYDHIRGFLEKVFDSKREVLSLRGHVNELRVVKSENEINLINEACHITGESLKHTMAVTQAGMNERSLHSMLECECKLRGAQMLAYPPVVAAGPRGNILHYINNDQRMEAGDMVLVDVGCEFNGYAADITRTWPVCGKFSDAQRRVYELVLHVQLACIQLCQKGASLDQIYHVMLHLLAREIESAKLLVDDKLEAKEIFKFVREFCPHHVGHWLGMDVHDTSSVPRSTKLVPGMVVTIEPGLYLKSDDMRVKPEYRGIAVRIEDDVLITSKQAHVLTANCPKYADEIEKLFETS